MLLLPMPKLVKMIINPQCGLQVRF